MPQPEADSTRRAIVMVWDGLRPDFITEQGTPHLFRLAASGVRFANSHAVFPTVTRANSSSIGTGVLPARHGIPSNMFHAPEAVQGGALNTGDAAQLEALRPLRGGRVLLRESLGERVSRAGGRTAVVSTGSPGSALLQHPEVKACGDILLHPAIQAGMRMAEVEARLGPMPGKTMPNTGQNAWFTRIITDLLLPEVGPRLLHFWHTDPDATQHARGIGHPDTLRAIRDADDNLGDVLAALDRLGLTPETDVIVASDHGFSTLTGDTDLTAELIRSGLKAAPDSDDVLITGELVYVRDSDPARVTAVTAFMQGLEAVGPLFTGARGAPVLPGTAPLDAIAAGGPFAPDILFSRNWNDAVNEHGVAGMAWSAAGPSKYAATHGAISPWEVRNTLVAAGPGFKRGLVSEIPAGNIDIAPTLLHLLGLGVPDDLDGRVLTEALTGGPELAAVVTARNVLDSATETFRQRLQFSTVGRTRYLDWGRVER